MVETSSEVHGRRTLVVVEDDAETRDLELFILESEGYNVIGLPDGEEAAETIKREGADLVILDLMLPKKDGLEVLAELELEPTTAKTPVIVVSAYVERVGGREVLRRSPLVKRVLHKPFDITELLDAIGRELGSGG